MKKYINFVLILLILLIPTNVLAIVDPTDKFYVNDYADVLSTETENYILEHSKNLDSKTKAQIVIVTIPSLEGNSLEEYATSLFRKFGIGDSKENNGLLILLSLEEREVRVEVGYGFEGLLPDGKTGRFQDSYMIPYFRKDNFNEGILNGYKAFYKEVVGYYELNELIDEPKETQDSFNWIILLVILIFYGMMFIFIVIMYKNNKGGRGGPFVSFGGRGFYGGSTRGGFGSSSRGFSGRGGFSGGGGSSRRF